MITLLLDKLGFSWWAKAIIIVLLLALLVVLLLYVVYPWAQNQFFPVDYQGIENAWLGSSQQLTVA